MSTHKVMQDISVHIERMRIEHLPTVLCIEQASYSDPWSEAAFGKEIENTVISMPVVATRNGAVAGYLVAWLVAGEAHIGNVAVALEHRRKGVGRQMLAWLLAHAATCGCTLCSLEVRVSNLAAQNLYAGFGFRAAALRKGYYTHPVEDAVVMLKTLNPVEEVD
ncbi:MAG: ribosomal protein S18-alanine N-acetyltransferase [candidate division Zixibacteria bacterium]|nr:ribosomal protein S18-alanine N-acetyltransferase [candidate division Zixibacteria bacterium]